MADNQIIQWAHKYAAVTDQASRNTAKQFLLKGLRDDIDVYVLIAGEPEYGPMFLESIEASLEALWLIHLAENPVDPTPWCAGCGSMTQAGCHCGPIAEND